MKYLIKSHDSRLVLRSIKNEDAEFLMELNNDRDISHFVVGSPKVVTLQEQMEWMNNIQSETNCKRFVVEYDDKLVGTVIVSGIDFVNLTGSVGIKLIKTAQGKGIGKQSIELVKQYCFDELKLVCLTSRVLTYNNASLALFKSCGFTNEGVLKSRVIMDNKRCDLVSFSFVKRDSAE